MEDPLKIIENFCNKPASSEWIINESGIPWLELDINVPSKELLNEIEPFFNKLVPFCSNISTKSETYKAKNEQAKRLNVEECVKSWEFITLYGIGSSIVSRQDDYDYFKDKNVSHKWTSVGEKCPLHKKIIEDIFILDDDITIMYAVLKPGGFTTPHTDKDKDSSEMGTKLTSLTLMVNNPKKCIFSYENWGKIPIKQGKFYLLNVSYFHTTHNKSNKNRFHLMFRIKNRQKTFIDYFKDKNIIQKSFIKQFIKKI